LNYAIPFDTTRFVEASIKEVYTTIFVAVGLVVLVIFVFLQDWRATVVPVVAIPVALIGTFAIMAMLGFSLNMLSLFGIVLAIGIVVDDAIVVVESTSRYISEGLSPKEAAITAMREITGPVIATTLVIQLVRRPYDQSRLAKTSRPNCSYCRAPANNAASREMRMKRSTRS